MCKYIYIIGLTIFLFACKNASTTTEVNNSVPHEDSIVVLNDTQFYNAGIQLIKPVNKIIHQTVTINGVVDVPPQSMISVSIPLGGYLKSTHLLPGTNVHKGEAIAVIEDQNFVQLQQDYLVAKAKLAYLEKDVQRQKELSDQDASSKKTYQQALADFNIQMAMLKGMEEKLLMININPSNLTTQNISRTVQLLSPINGYVTKVNVNIGRYVNPSDVLFELVNPDDIHAAMTVFEKDIALFQKGITGKVALTSDTAKKFDVEVILVTKNVNDNRTGMLHCHFEKPNHSLLPGMFLTGVFNVTSHQAIVVPENAVVHYNGKEYVFVQNSKNSFVATPVETGISENGYIELKPTANKNWLAVQLAGGNAYALMGKLKNKMED
ncbi:MAG: efflux RND transporter periplasmic adaptor subunit [Bacteroidota bacterium]|jgi:cobalt-zinc-cadmium efflux system membrane fusion protein|nr:efflux RND transporter periplasmic adaptor subunit [Bacteroidota bacterium]